MCCDGTLYDHAKVYEDEAAQTEQAGFKVVRADPLQPVFLFPCQHLDDKCCTAYNSWRPKVCSSFFCELQKNTADGEYGEAEALDLIANAQACRTQIMETMPEGSSFPDARRRFNAVASSKEPLPPEDARLVVRMFVLDRLLDKHFRKPGKSRLPAPKVQEGRLPAL
ncbi:MAG: hypothetical protein C0409_08180 [Novosphingobium sp.]|nr:hypothetical protein [Novosphingobium sp.]